MLHELIRYAEREGLHSEPGFRPKWVRWLIVFTPDGRFLNVVDLKGDNKKSKGREFLRCPDLGQGEMVAAKSRHFLVDSVDKVVLLTKDEPAQKELDHHDSYVGLLRVAGATIPMLATVATALDDEATLSEIRKQLTDVKAKPTDAATIAVMDGASPNIFVSSTDWHDWWRSYRQRLRGDGENAKPDSQLSVMRCYLSGELVEPAATQNKITGLSDVGGLATGDVLSSFDKEAFGHYGFSKGENAAISVQMVKQVTDSLNHLIQNRSHRMCQTKIMHWFDRPIALEDDPLADVFDDATDVDEDGEPSAMEQVGGESTAARLLRSIRSGENAELANCQFFALTLSGNSGRVIARDWMQGRFETLAANIAKWFEQLSIVSRDGKQVIRRHKFAAVLGAMVRDLRDMPSPTVATLWQCAIAGLPIPSPLAAQTLARVKVDLIQDQLPRHARMGLLRAFLLRNPDSGISSMSESVDDTLDSPAYLCGRIMSLLATIQEKALGNVGAGVVQRYYAAASATPALVLGRLVRTAQIAHLPKIDSGLRHHLDGQLADLWNRMRTSPPTTLTLEEQTLFAMGFYQQQAARFKKAATTSVGTT